MNKDEALRMALDAMQYADACLRKQLTTKVKHEYAQDLLLEATKACKEALAQPEREWVGLTNEELREGMKYWSDSLRSAYGGAYAAEGEYFNVEESWRYIEAKLRIKNT